jgi:hypothetical protein
MMKNGTFPAENHNVSHNYSWIVEVVADVKNKTPMVSHDQED